MPEVAPVPSAKNQFAALLLVQWSKVRHGWGFHLLFPILGGVGLVWTRKLIAVEGLNDGRFVVGAAITTAMFSTLNPVTHEAALARHQGELRCLGNLPVSRRLVAASMLIVPLITAIPATGASLLASAVLLDVNLTFDPTVLVATALLLALLTEVGLILGLTLPFRLTSVIASAAPMLLVLGTPILVDGDAAPLVMRRIGDLSPISTLADAFAGSLLSNVAQPSALLLLYPAALVLLLAPVILRVPQWRS
jgi:hypothetical protein